MTSEKAPWPTPEDIKVFGVYAAPTLPEIAKVLTAAAWAVENRPKLEALANDIEELRALAWHQATLAFVNSETVDELLAERREREAALADALRGITESMDLIIQRDEAEAKLARARAALLSAKAWGASMMPVDLQITIDEALADPPRTAKEETGQ